MSYSVGGETLEQEERELGGEGRDGASACQLDFHVPGTVGVWTVGVLLAGWFWVRTEMRF